MQTICEKVGDHDEWYELQSFMHPITPDFDKNSPTVHDITYKDPIRGPLHDSWDEKELTSKIGFALADAEIKEFAYNVYVRWYESGSKNFHGEWSTKEFWSKTSELVTFLGYAPKPIVPNHAIYAI